MAFQVKVLADSIAPRRHRLTTFRIRFPRIILAEVNTHKVLNKSSASSRAIPFGKMLAAVLADPYIPLTWPAEAAGGKNTMQGNAEVDLRTRAESRADWLDALTHAADVATRMHARGIHRETPNRLIEPWAWVTQVTTGTEWANFFGLRTDKDAHPAFRFLSRAMYIAYTRSTPAEVGYGQWHLPYVRPEDRAAARIACGADDVAVNRVLCEISAARCARTSFETFDGKVSTYADDAVLFGKLMGGAIKHAGPTEHQAEPMHVAWEASFPKLRSNLTGWIQFRKTLPHENITEFAPAAHEVAGWEIQESVFGD